VPSACIFREFSTFFILSSVSPAAEFRVSAYLIERESARAREREREGGMEAGREREHRYIYIYIHTYIYT
jgi:hypothetical protein